jgi:hypothetical protein
MAKIGIMASMTGGHGIGCLKNIIHLVQGHTSETVMIAMTAMIAVIK